MFEDSAGVNIVAGIDANFLAVACCHIGYTGCEMYISYQWSCIAIGFQPLRYVFHILGFTCSLCSEAHQLTSCIDDAFGLCHATFGIVGVFGGHRLDADRVIASDAELSYVGNG